MNTIGFHGLYTIVDNSKIIIFQHFNLFSLYAILRAEMEGGFRIHVSFYLYVVIIYYFLERKLVILLIHSNSAFFESYAIPDDYC